MIKRMLSLLFILGQIQSGFALSHSRAYQWDFPSPNLVANWSFENPMEFWQEFPLSGMTISSRTLSSYPQSGSFVAMVSGTSSVAHEHLTSDRFRVEPSKTYTLSFFYKTNGTLTGTMYPYIAWYSEGEPGGGTLGSITANSFAPVAVWTLYTRTFTTAANAGYLRIALASSLAGTSGTVYFDDVVLEEGSLSEAQVMDNRLKIAQSIAYGDAFGRVHETQALAKSGTNTYLIGGSGFDDFARPETTFLATPKTLNSIGFQTGLLAGAQAYYNNDATTFNAMGYPFSRVKYVADAPSRVTEASSPGSAWQFGNGHTVKQDYYFVSDFLIPANIENPPANNANCPYRLSWSKNQDSTYTLTWTDNSGFVIRKATNITRNASSANTWKWAATRYEYYPNGALKKVYTPIDDSAGTSNFAEVSQSDAQGRIISSTSPDRGLRKFWYTRTGLLRFSQDEEQRAAGEFTYMDYDALGRLVSTGIQSNVGASPPEACVDQDACSTGNKFEQIGYIYDDTTAFQARTGFSLLDILGSAKANVDVPKLSHRLFCKYNRNADNTLAGLSAKDKFVADFFTYDEIGNVKTAWKYTGPVRDPLKRLQDCAYTYDSRNRVTRFVNHVSATEAGISSSQSYEYDFMGRMSAIKGVGDRYLARYTYADWGGLNRVALGGLASEDSTTFLDYWYHIQGGLRVMQAASKMGANSRPFYAQFLGYEGKAFPMGNTPPQLQAKYDGSITQQLYKYANWDASAPVRLVNYAYDQLGRMGKAMAYLNVNATPLDVNENINSAQLTMSANEDFSTSMEYDLNGRILGQKSGGVSSADSARYSYASNSYRLDHVTGKLTPQSLRNLSSPGTFTYDFNGSMLRDKSRRLTLAYGWDGLPVSFTVDSAAARGWVRCCIYDASLLPAPFKVSFPSVTLHNFYDADGNRVSRMETENGPHVSSLRYRGTHFVYVGPGMVKEWREDYNQAGRIKKTSTIVSLFGRGAQIGRIRPDGKYEFFIKNHLGSTVRTVDDRGRYNNGSEKAYDYLSYGISKVLKTGSDTTDVRQKFTGKEYEALTGLYAFGWRWHDPELGMWMSPDPAEQFFNPYSYNGGNPINFIDPNGRECIDPSSGVMIAEENCPNTDSGNKPTPSDDGIPEVDPPPSPGIVETVVSIIVAGIAGLSALEVDIGGVFSSGDGTGWSEGLENSSASTKATQNGSSVPNDQKFDFYWNRGESRIDQSTHMENGQRMVDNIPDYLGGLTDKFMALPYYGAPAPIPNQTIGVMPDIVNGPGGAGGLVGAAGRGLAARGLSGQSSKILEASTRQLNKLFSKHGADLGLEGAWNASQASQVRSVLNQHINSEGVRSIAGTYRGQAVTHYVNPTTGVNVMSSGANSFVGGWKLSAEQLQSVLSTGRLY
jgi:RHS repeat-associated protein